MTQRVSRDALPLRRLAVVLAVAVLVTTAGCTSFTGGGGASGSADAQVDSVPARADTIAFVDAQGMLGDDNLRSIANTYFEQQAELMGDYYSGPKSTEDALTQMENESGLSASDVETMTIFSSAKKQVGGQQGEFSGAIVTSSFTKDELKSALTEESSTSYSTETYKETTLWVAPKDSYSNTQDAVAWLGDGRFVIGNLAAVKSVVDVDSGDADAVSGDLRDTFENTRDGYVQFAVSVPQNQFDAGNYQSGQFDTSSFNSVQMVSGAFYTSGSDVGMTMNLAANTTADANDIKDVTSGALSLYKGLVEDDTVKSALDKVEVTKDGNTVTMSYENSAANIQAAIEEIYNTSASSSTSYAAPAL